MKRTYTFEKNDSTLLLVTKGFDLLEKPDMPVEVGNELCNYPQMLEFFHKHYSCSNTVNHKDAETFYIKKLGDIVMEIDPNAFKDAVYDSAVVNFIGSTIPSLLEALINKIRLIPIDSLILDFSEVQEKRISDLSDSEPLETPKFLRLGYV